MSIVKLSIFELPKEGDVVYCDNGAYSSDRAIFRNGYFMGGGDMSKPYKMNYVTKWFDFRLYDNYFRAKGETCYSVSFDIADNIIVEA